MSKLRQLAESDPAKFKAVTQQISQDLAKAAGSASGADADALKKLSDKFAEASASGSVDALSPRRDGARGHHGGHHHHGGGGAVGAALSSALDSVQKALGDAGASSAAPAAASPAPATSGG